MDYVEEAIQPGSPISEHFIRELHQLTVEGLEREGDLTPGQYRKKTVVIAGAEHLPPDPIAVSGYMEELTDFINQEHAPKYDLLKMALAHHRFCWIHPFGNGNGRVVRLLSYAMLIKYGFNVQAGGRVLNPTAVFCNDRNSYYSMLSQADTGTDEGLADWSLYVLRGIRDELQKIDNLTRYDYLKREILAPALVYSRDRELITEQEESVLSMAIDKREFKAGDVNKVLPKLTPRQRTYQISKLLDNHMVRPIREGSRTYVIDFTNSYLLRSVVHALEAKGFIPPLIKKG
jgi:Fic family protein